MADWFAQNAPAAAAVPAAASSAPPPGGDWFAKNAPDASQPGNLQRFAQSWWDNSVLKHPIDSAVGLVKSLVTMPDYHQLSPAEKDAIDTQTEKAFQDFMRTPENAGQLAARGTNAAMLLAATAGLAKGLGAAVDVAPQTWAGVKAGVKVAAPDVAMGLAKGAAGEVLAKMPGMEGPARYGVQYPAARQIGRGVANGITAGRTAFNEKLAAAAESLKNPPRPTPAAAPAPVPEPAGLLEAGPKVHQMPAAADPSYVKAVPAQYAERAPGWEPPKGAEVRVPEPVEAEAKTSKATRDSDLDGLSRALANKPFLKLNPQERQAVVTLYDAGQTRPAAPAVTAPVSAPPAAAPAAPAPPVPPGPSIAEQLRAEILKDPNVKPEDIAPPADETDPAALRDLMRSVPPEAGNAIARANFAGNPDSGTAGAVYSAAARNAKATKLAEALHNAGVTHTDATRLMNEGDWKTAAEAIGAPKPKSGRWLGSPTVEETLFHLRRIEKSASAANPGH